MRAEDALARVKTCCVVKVVVQMEWAANPLSVLEPYPASFLASFHDLKIVTDK